MNLDDVAEEIRSALKTITGLRVPEWGVQTVVSPAALVGLPVRIDYDETYQRGSDRYPDLEVYVLVGKPEARAARTALAKYAAGAGSKSVKQAVESYAFTSCDKDSVRVASCEFEEVKYAGVPYLAAIFHLDIIGKGA
jgi:hypothetical protein